MTSRRKCALKTRRTGFRLCANGRRKYGPPRNAKKILTEQTHLPIIFFMRAKSFYNKIFLKYNNN